MADLPLRYDQVFVVGLPRSGTKLLRDLLNCHTRVSIPVAETHFLPYLIHRFGRDFVMETDQDARELYGLITKSTFYFYLHREGVELDFHRFRETCLGKDLAGIFRFLLVHFSPKQGKDILYGDKTPGYLRHLPLLLETFPHAAFVCLVRDPRDYCLSVRKTWNKDIYRAAEVWTRTMEQFARDDRDLGSPTQIIPYERLIQQPEIVLAGLCGHLGLDYEPEMTNLSRPSENYGAARGRLEIMSDNLEKYRTDLSQREIRRIEEITYDQMIAWKYEPVYAQGFRKLSRSRREVGRWRDAFSSSLFHMREEGPWTGLRTFIRHHLQSSWHR